MENQASRSAKAQPGQHKDLYCGNIVTAVVVSNLLWLGH